MSRALVLAIALVLGAPVVRSSALGAQETRGTLRRTLPIATRDIMRGDTLGASDIAMRDTMLVWHWNSAPSDTASVVPGWVARRNIAAGELLRTPAVMAPPLVTSGQTVSVLYEDGPVRLVLKGVATNTAPLGAPVGVRISATRRLDGVAVAPNTVRIR